MSDICKRNSAGVAAEIADNDELNTTTIAHEKKIAIATVFRWITRGLPAAVGGRVRLEAVRRGRKWLTSRAALRRFFAALPTSSSASEVSTADSLHPRQRAADDAKSQLRDRFGI